MGINAGHSRSKGSINPPVNPRRPIRPFGMAAPPYNPVEGRYMKLKAGDSSVPIEVVRAYIVSEEDDYLICKFVSSEQEVNVAKPYTLRRTPYDGDTFSEVAYVYSDENTRVASKSGETDETQHITPDYAAGEEILIMRHDTGVDLPEGAGPILWEDMNTAGRTWATEV